MELIITLTTLIIFIIGFAILNRGRGNWASPFAKNAVPLILSWLFGFPWWGYILMWGAYRLGESFGWGKYIGTIVGQRKPRYDDHEGCNDEGIIPGFCDGVQKIAGLFVNEREDHILYCHVCLIVRAFYWWILPVILLYFLGSVSLIGLLLGLIVLMATMPVSYEAAYHIDWFPISKFIEHKWAWGEIIYGAFHGLVFWIWFVM